MLKSLITLAASLALLTSCAPPYAIGGPPPAFPETQTQPAGAVSAADPRATAAGEAILAKGGSATDAAIAVMLALTVVEPQSSGVGGGGFMIHAGADGVTTFDGRETAYAHRKVSQDHTLMVVLMVHHHKEDRSTRNFQIYRRAG